MESGDRRVGQATPLALPLDDFAANSPLIQDLKARFGQGAAKVRDLWKPIQRANRLGQTLYEELSDACSEVF